MNIGKYLVPAIIMLALLGGCEKQGPAERMGEDIDNAVEKTGDSIEEAGDAAEDALN